MGMARRLHSVITFYSAEHDSEEGMKSYLQIKRPEFSFHRVRIAISFTHIKPKTYLAPSKEKSIHTKQKKTFVNIACFALIKLRYLKHTCQEYAL